MPWTTTSTALRVKRGHLLSLSPILYSLHFAFKSCVLSLPLYLLDRWSGNNWEHPNFPFAGTTGRIAWAYEGQIACPMDAKNVTAPHFHFDSLGITKRPLPQITHELQQSLEQSIRTDSRPFTDQIVRKSSKEVLLKLSYLALVISLYYICGRKSHFPSLVRCDKNGMDTFKFKKPSFPP